jgi:hypothetical protein
LKGYDRGLFHVTIPEISREDRGNYDKSEVSPGTPRLDLFGSYRHVMTFLKYGLDGQSSISGRDRVSKLCGMPIKIDPSVRLSIRMKQLENGKPISIKFDVG